MNVNNGKVSESGAYGAVTRLGRNAVASGVLFIRAVGNGELYNKYGFHWKLNQPLAIEQHYIYLLVQLPAHAVFWW